MDIQPVKQHHFKGIYDLYMPFVLNSVVSFEVKAVDPRLFYQRIAGSMDQFPWLVCVHDEVVTGFAYGARHRVRHAYRWTVETSVYVDPSYHRKGIGKGLYTSLLDLLTAMGYQTALAGITLPNVASVTLHEKMGFEPVGIYRRTGYKFGIWHDVGWWQKPLADYPTPPRDPVAFASLLHSNTLNLALQKGQRLLSFD